MLRLRKALIAAAAILTLAAPAHAAPQVVASIKPVHALVAAVMKGVGTPALIVDGTASPHNYSLRPSAARALANADVVFWVGPPLEGFLVRALDTLAGDSRAVALIDAPNVVRLPFRDGHDHDDEHGEENRHGHGHENDHEDRHEGEGRAEHTGHEDAHDAAAIDGHIWLEPANARVLAQVIAEALAEIDPENAGIYAANAEGVSERIAIMTAEIGALLAPVRNRPFVVFHDAYGYFESHFGLRSAGAITVRPDSPPSAERLRTIRTRIRTTGAACVFSEPQFDDRLVDAVSADTLARTAVLDPLGAGLPAGPDLYFTLMRDMAAAMRACLSPTG
jgi:zinc transport system substrate-binding protein